jgi:hypothetical protein
VKSIAKSALTRAMCEHLAMSARNIAHLLGVAVAMTWMLLSTVIDTHSASAGPCPDVEVVFARGTNEPPGLGNVGQAFIDSLRSQVAGRSVEAYAAMPGLMSNPRLRIAPAPKWCSVVIRRARKS